jgi:hypothetical protein
MRRNGEQTAVRQMALQASHPSSVSCSSSPSLSHRPGRRLFGFESPALWVCASPALWVFESQLSGFSNPQLSGFRIAAFWVFESQLFGVFESPAPFGFAASQLNCSSLWQRRSRSRSSLGSNRRPLGSNHRPLGSNHSSPGFELQSLLG